MCLPTQEKPSMRNVSLDQFYRRINKKILLIGGYTDDKLMPNIIKSCRLKPISVFSNRFDENTVLESVWADEFDSNIEIRNKKPRINLHARKFHTTITDIYRNETIEFLIAHGAMACIGLYPDSQNFILLLKGTDNYFRCWSCQNGELSLCSPLTVGLKVLRQCFPKHLRYFQKLEVKSELKELREVEWLITTLPAHKLMSENIETYNQLRSVLYNEG
jgi:hypothetical protein